MLGNSRDQGLAIKVPIEPIGSASGNRFNPLAPLDQRRHRAQCLSPRFLFYAAAQLREVAAQLRLAKPTTLGTTPDKDVPVTKNDPFLLAFEVGAVSPHHNQPVRVRRNVNQGDQRATYLVTGDADLKALGNELFQPLPQPRLIKLSGLFRVEQASRLAILIGTNYEMTTTPRKQGRDVLGKLDLCSRFLRLVD